MDDGQLDELHERVRKTLLESREDMQDRIREHRASIRALELLVRQVEDASKQEQWWRLSPWLDGETIDSLCECSPANLLDL